MPDLNYLDSNRFAVSYETFLRDCPQCMKAIPISGPISQVECPECRSNIPIPASIWDSLFERAHLDWFDRTEFDVVESPPSEFKEPQGRFKVEVRRTLHAEPPCIHCGAAISAENLSSSIDCGSCGKPLKYLPLQRSSEGMVVTHVCATELDTPANATPVELPQSETAPVAMACPLCSANLQVAGDSPRTITCEYCSGSVFLPVALWRRLHPVKTVTRWATVHQATAKAFLKKARFLAFKGPLVPLGGVGFIVGVISARELSENGFQLRTVMLAGAIFLVLGLWPALRSMRRSRPFFRAARRFRGSDLTP